MPTPPDVKNAFKDFVDVAIDKANRDIALVCKTFNISVLVKEWVTNNSKLKNLSVIDIINENIINLKTKFDIEKPINARCIIVPLTSFVKILTWTITSISHLFFVKFKHMIIN